MKRLISTSKISIFQPVFYATLILALLVAGCKKDDAGIPDGELTAHGLTLTTEAAFIQSYTNLSPVTVWELQQARAATAKYKRIEKALADGYVDIAVDVQHMGHHYLNANLLDASFDVKHPEILVYNRDENGQQQLVAVEYAVPLGNPRPAGFTGSDDVWDENAGFGLWLLHAWVWYQNPDGVFAPFNPLVELH